MTVYGAVCVPVWRSVCACVWRGVCAGVCLCVEGCVPVCRGCVWRVIVPVCGGCGVCLQEWSVQNAPTQVSIPGMHTHTPPYQACTHTSIPGMHTHLHTRHAHTPPHSRHTHLHTVGTHNPPYTGIPTHTFQLGTILVVLITACTCTPRSCSQICDV